MVASRASVVPAALVKEFGVVERAICGNWYTALTVPVDIVLVAPDPGSDWSKWW